MAQSLARILLHIVFSTKNRAPFLKDKDLRGRLHAYIATVLHDLKCEPILVNGTEDHIHILCHFARTITVADLVEEVKRAPSKWIKSKGPEYQDFYWQGGYGVFSVSESNADVVRTYIANQEEHHRRLSFQDEFRALCQKHGIEFDERYVWD